MVALIALLTANEEQKEREKGGRGKVLFLFCFVISVFQNLFFEGSPCALSRGTDSIPLHYNSRKGERQ